MRRAPATGFALGSGGVEHRTRRYRTLGRCMLVALAGLSSPGCAVRDRDVRQTPTVTRPVVAAVAPVLNLSNSTDLDPLTLTDMLATELAATGRFAVVPVNRVLAILAEQGLSSVTTPEQARGLGRRLGVDGVLVAAVTDFDPYSPPRIAWTAQWYPLDVPEEGGGLDPVAASRLASDPRPARRAGAGASVVQVQRVVDASRPDELERIRAYDRQVRGGHESPYGWKVHTVSQQLFLRYSCWALIRTMKTGRAGHGPQRPQQEGQP